MKALSFPLRYISQLVWDSSNRRKYYRFNKVLMGAVTRDTFTLVNDSLIKRDKQLGPYKFFSAGYFSPYPAGKTNNPRILKDLFLRSLLQKIDPHRSFRICRWLPVFGNWEKKENRFLGATNHLFFLACCQLLAFYHFKGFFHSFCGSSLSRSQSLCLLSSSFLLQKLFLFLQLL